MAIKFPYTQNLNSGAVQGIRSLQIDATSRISDTQLWQEFKSGSETAFAAIYKDNVSRLYNYGLKLVKDGDLVRDAIQDLFVELWDAKERLGEVRSIKSYLYKSIRRKCIAQAAKQRNFSTEINATMLEPTPSAEHSLMEKQQFDQKRKELRKALAKLNKDQQEIIYLKYYGRLSYQEISEIMNLDKKAIYNLMARTIHGLRQYLETLMVLGLFLLF